MQTVALGILVFARTGQPGWTGLVAAAGFLPIGLLAPVGGGGLLSGVAAAVKLTRPVVRVIGVEPIIPVGTGF